MVVGIFLAYCGGEVTLNVILRQKNQRFTKRGQSYFGMIEGEQKMMFKTV